MIENDIYDVIFIVARFSSLDSIVQIIENNKSKNIVFVGNNMSVEKYANKKDKNVLNCVNKKNLCAFIYRFMFSNFIGKICISDHAMSAYELKNRRLNGI